MEKALFQAIKTAILNTEFKPPKEAGLGPQALQELEGNFGESGDNLLAVLMPSEFNIIDIGITIAHALPNQADFEQVATFEESESKKFIVAPRAIAHRIKTNLLMGLGLPDNEEKRPPREI